MRRRQSAANPVDRTSMREPCERGGCEQRESCPPAGVNNSAQRWPASAKARPAPLCRRYAAGNRPQGFAQRCDGQLAPSGAVHTTTEAHDGPLLHPRLTLYQHSHVDPGLQPHAERALVLRTYKLIRPRLASARPMNTPRSDSTAVDLRGVNTRVISLSVVARYRKWGRSPALEREVVLILLSALQIIPGVPIERPV